MTEMKQHIVDCELLNNVRISISGEATLVAI